MWYVIRLINGKAVVTRESQPSNELTTDGNNYLDGVLSIHESDNDMIRQVLNGAHYTVRAALEDFLTRIGRLDADDPEKPSAADVMAADAFSRWTQ